MVARYRRDYPQVRLRLLSRSVAQAIELARHNDANLGIIPGRPLPDDLVFHDWLTFAAFLLLPPATSSCGAASPPSGTSSTRRW